MILKSTCRRLYGFSYMSAYALIIYAASERISPSAEGEEGSAPRPRKPFQEKGLSETLYLAFICAFSFNWLLISYKSKGLLQCVLQQPFKLSFSF